jgi:hypothetical protein
MNSPLTDERLKELLAARVKPLAWGTSPSSGMLKAETIIGTARVWTHHEADEKWFWQIAGVSFGEAAGPNEAQSALETDYRQRILSALDPTLLSLRQKDGEMVEAAIEGCAELADFAADEQDVLALSADESHFASYRQGERVAKAIAASIRATLSQRSAE